MSKRAIAGMTVAIVLVFCAALVGAASAASVEGTFTGDVGAERDVQETIWFQGFVADDVSGEPISATYTV